jgi:ribosomal protein S18 acetylase RimI-like enzyme
VSASLWIAPLDSSHRSRVETIVRATGVFSEEEVGVAMEVFDAGAAVNGNRKSEMGGGTAFPGPMSDVRFPMSDYELLGAFSGSDLLGYAAFGPTPATDRTFDLYWIAVHPDAQRSGAGAALMDAVERRLAGVPARMLVIETSSRDAYAPTRRFYEKRGYAEAARLRDFYAPKDDRIVLTRRLDAAPSPGGPDRSPLPAPHP